MTALDILTAEADRYDERTARALRKIRRELEVLFAADPDELAAAIGARPAPERWPTAAEFADHLGVDLLIEARWNTAHLRESRQPTVALANEKLRRLWPDDVQPGSVTFAELPADPTPPPGDGIPALAAAYRGERDGWTPRPEDFAPAPDDTMPGREALTPRSVVQAGPRSRIGRWVDEQLQRPGRWWRAKQAATSKRLGVGE